MASHFLADIIRQTSQLTSDGGGGKDDVNFQVCYAGTGVGSIRTEDEIHRDAETTRCLAVHLFSAGVRDELGASVLCSEEAAHKSSAFHALTPPDCTSGDPETQPWAPAS